MEATRRTLDRQVIFLVARADPAVVAIRERERRKRLAGVGRITAVVDMQDCRTSSRSWTHGSDLAIAVGSRLNYSHCFPVRPGMSMPRGCESHTTEGSVYLTVEARSRTVEVRRIVRDKVGVRIPECAQRPVRWRRTVVASPLRSTSVSSTREWEWWWGADRRPRASVQPVRGLANCDEQASATSQGTRSGRIRSATTR